MTLDQWMEKRKKNKTVNRYFMPITNGTVIDHIPQGLGLKIRQFLASKNILAGGVKHTIEDVMSKKHKGKDVLALEDIFIPEPIIGTIASFAPGMTFNIIEKNKFRKIKVDAPNMTSGIGKCPNENCITNHDGEASPKFIHTEDNLRCHYCEKYF